MQARLLTRQPSFELIVSLIPFLEFESNVVPALRRGLRLCKATSGLSR